MGSRNRRTVPRFRSRWFWSYHQSGDRRRRIYADLWRRGGLDRGRILQPWASSPQVNSAVQQLKGEVSNNAQGGCRPETAPTMKQHSTNGLVMQPLRAGALRLIAGQHLSRGSSPVQSSLPPRGSRLYSVVHPLSPLGGLP